MLCMIVSSELAPNVSSGSRASAADLAAPETILPTDAALLPSDGLDTWASALWVRQRPTRLVEAACMSALPIVTLKPEPSKIAITPCTLHIMTFCVTIRAYTGPSHT